VTSIGRCLGLLLAGALLVAARASAETIVLVGDSISAGAGASSPKRAYAFRLERALVREHRVVNYSRGGWSVAADVGVIDPADVPGAAALAPDVVVLALGTNDYGGGLPLDDFRAGYQAALEALAAVGTVVCVTPYRRSDAWEATRNAAGGVPSDYRAAVRAACEAAGRIPLDGFEALPSQAFLPDGIHPNDAGHSRIAKWLEKALAPILEAGP
jgi:lysophospholipase L1-like esterase